MSGIPKTTESRPRPDGPGKGYRFLEVGELVKPGDEFFTTECVWKPVILTRIVVSVASKQHYRRAVG